LHTGELKRISSFPDDFKFTSWENAANRMGNSVPPLMMKAIAVHIRDEILSKI
jgi:DNA (cytosine-5)-methyltransferase 1